MGTGVGEAMIIGAVTGAGTSAVTGGDPLKGALLGAAGGGAGASIAGLGATAAPTAATGATGAATGTATGASGAGLGTATDLATQQTVMGNLGAGESFYGADLSGALTPAQTGAGQVTSATQAAGSSALPPISPSDPAFYQDLSRLTAGESGLGAGQTAGSPTFPSLNAFYARNPVMMPAGLGATSAAIGQSYDVEGLPEPEKYSGPLSRFRYDPDKYRSSMAGGGLADSAVAQRYMKGGHLGSYSDGGRLLKGPGDGMSDSIPATIGRKQPARLADSEFVVPADVVSHLGNGSTDAGAKRLYEMMDRVRKARTGRKSQGKEINPSKYMPA
jgi:hypothetical protein